MRSVFYIVVFTFIQNIFAEEKCNLSAFYNTNYKMIREVCYKDNKKISCPINSEISRMIIFQDEFVEDLIWFKMSNSLTLGFIKNSTQNTLCTKEQFAFYRNPCADSNFCSDLLYVSIERALFETVSSYGSEKIVKTVFLEREY